MAGGGAERNKSGLAKAAPAEAPSDEESESFLIQRKVRSVRGSWRIVSKKIAELEPEGVQYFFMCPHSFSHLSMALPALDEIWPPLWLPTLVSVEGKQIFVR